MKQDRPSDCTDTDTVSSDRSSCILSILLSLLLFCIPVFPDVKIARPKLLLIEVGLSCLVASWLLAAFVKAKLFVRRIPIAGPLFCYVATAVIYFSLAPNRPVAAGELTRIILSLLAFIAITHAITGHRDRAIVVSGYLAGSFLAILYGILQHYGGFWIVVVPPQTRIASTFGNPIFFAAYLVVMLPLALGLFLSLKKTVSRGLTVLLLAGGTYALLHTQTRAAFIGFAVSGIVFAFLSLKSRSSRTIFTLLFIAVTVGAVAAGNGIWHREQAHFLIWRDSLAMWLAHPWTGTGLGTFHLSFPLYASEELKQLWPPGKFIVNDAHNEFLQVLTETGIIGLGLYLWLLVAFFRSAAAIAAERSGRERYLIYGCIASCAGILAQNFFSVDMRFTISSVSLFFVMGIVMTFTDKGLLMGGFAPLTRIGGIASVLIGLYAVVPYFMQPYLARQHLASLPDFFDEKVLEPVRTIAELEVLSRKYPDQAPVFEKLAWVYAKEKKWPDAIRNYEKACALDPSRAGPFNNLGNIHFLLGNDRHAIEFWNRSLSVNPRQADARLNLATAYYHQGSLNEAAGQLREVLKIDPGNEKAVVMLKQMKE